MTHIELIFVQRVKSVSVNFVQRVKSVSDSFFSPGGFQVPVASKCDILSKVDYKLGLWWKAKCFDLIVFTCFAKSVKRNS